jgi:D-alanyl-D-alanine carboxypeptidase
MTSRLRKLPLALFATLLLGALLASAASAAPRSGAAPRPSAAPAATASRPFPAAIQKRLAEALDSSWGKTVAPGAIVAVSVGDRSWTATRGTTRKGTRIRPRLGDHTRIGSLTKTFVGTLILQLSDDGKLKLSDTIDRWLPWVPNASQITIRELGEMSSGLNTYTADQGFLDAYFADPRAAWTPIEVIKLGVSLPPKFAPGQGFFYSNTNFLLLAKIAEKVTGKPIGHLLRERIFDPLGMTHTSYPYTTALPAPFWSGYTNQDADGTGTSILDATHWNPTPFGAAGQIVSNLHDMRIWTKAVGTGALLSKAAFRQHLTPNPFAVKGVKKYEFGIGQDNGWITHAGTVPGFNSDFGYLPKLGASIVVLTNTDIEATPRSQPSVLIMSALSAVVAPDDVSTP